MERPRICRRDAFKVSTGAVTGLMLMLAIALLLSGCGPMTPFERVMLKISPDAATGPDYVAEGSIDSAKDVDYYELVPVYPIWTDVGSSGSWSARTEPVTDTVADSLEMTTTETLLVVGVTQYVGSIGR